MRSRVSCLGQRQVSCKLPHSILWHSLNQLILMVGNLQQLRLIYCSHSIHLLPMLVVFQLVGDPPSVIIHMWAVATFIWKSCEMFYVLNVSIKLQPIVPHTNVLYNLQRILVPLLGKSMSSSQYKVNILDLNFRFQWGTISSQQTINIHPFEFQHYNEFTSLTVDHLHECG